VPAAPPAVAPTGRVGAVVLVLTVVGFVLAPLGDVPLWLVSGLGATAAAAIGLRDGPTTRRRLVRAAGPAFLVEVAALLVVVRAAAGGPLGDLADDLVGGHRAGSLVDLLVVATVAAGLANLVNNLPAVLLLARLLTGAPTEVLLAAVVGASVGCTVLPHGSLATLLWRQLLEARGRPAPLRGFVVAGCGATPVVLAAAVVGLWLVA
jgi:arsenical pump membrane protein